jgi:hypothetical protein
MRTTDHPTTGHQLALLEQASRARGPASLPNRADILDYVADMLLELKSLAAKSDCPMLLGLISLAQLEAAERARVAAFMDRHNR